jgi:hypothetical protein
LQRANRELDYNCKRTNKLLETSESALQFERDEVTRLYQSLQDLEKQLVANAEERKRLVQRVDLVQQEAIMAHEKVMFGFIQRGFVSGRGCEVTCYSRGASWHKRS